MTDKFFAIHNKKFCPKRSVYHRYPSKVFKTSAAKRCHLRIRGTLHKRACYNVAQLACKSDSVIVSFTCSFHDSTKTHRRNKAFHRFKIFGSVEILRHKNVVVVDKKIRRRCGIAFFFSASHRMPDYKIHIGPKNFGKGLFEYSFYA